MLRQFLPNGILGIVLASLIAAYMSTVSTQINWGASYLVNDFYSRFINPNASEKKKVLVGRMWTIALIVLSIILALYLESALQVFQYMLLIGAGTGLIYLLRWFWWRINAWSEISAMIGAMVFSLIVIIVEKTSLVYLNDQTVLLYGFEMQKGFWDTMKFVFVVVFNSILWITVTLHTKPTEEKVLLNFYKKIRPGGPGWKKITKRHSEIEKNRMTKDWNVPAGLLCMSISCIGILSMLFSMGYLIYGNYLGFAILLAVTIISAIALFKSWGKIFN